MFFFLVASWYGVRQIVLEENIFSFLPAKSELIKKYKLIFSDLPIFERIYFLINSENDLVTGGDLLYDALSGLEQVKSIDMVASPDAPKRALRYGVQHLPHLLDPVHYPELEKKIMQVDQYLSSASKILSSPIGVGFKPIFQEDPLGIREWALRPYQNLQVSTNVTLDEGYLVSQDKETLLLAITPTFAANDTREGSRFMEAMQPIIHELMKEGYSVAVYGTTPIAFENAKQVKKDMNQILWFSSILIFLFLWFFFQRKWNILWIILPVGIGGLGALTVFGFVWKNLSLVSLGLSTILMGVLVDQGIHLIACVEKAGKKKGVNQIRHPLIFSSLTSCLAFLGMAIIGSKGFFQMGVLAALSVFLGAIFSLFILPEFILTSNGNRPKRWAFPKVPFATKNILFIGLASLIALAFGITEVRFNTKLSDLNYMNEDMKELESRFHATWGDMNEKIYASVTGGNWQELHKRVDEFRMANTNKIWGVDALLPSMAKQAKNLEAWGDYWTEKKLKKIKAAWQSHSKAYAFQPALVEGILEKWSSPQMISPIKLLQALPETMIQDWVIEQRDGFKLNFIAEGDLKETEGVDVIDRRVMADELLKNLYSDFLFITLITLALVMLVTGFAFPTWKMWLVGVFPLCASWISTLGLMGLIGLEFNLVNLILAVFVFGLGVDYSLYQLNALKRNNDLMDVQRVILLSGFTTLIGFGMLALAKHPAMYSLGKVALIGIGSVLLWTIYFQPACYQWLIGDLEK